MARKLTGSEALLAATLFAAIMTHARGISLAGRAESPLDISFRLTLGVKPNMVAQAALATHWSPGCLTF
jgi:hypothetical protein